MKKLFPSLVAIVVAAGAPAAPIQWTEGSGGNGHYYDYVGTGTTWGGAVLSASALNYLGNAGYLATVTSQGEQDFMHALNGNTAWIGGEYSGSAWRWATGPEASLTFFGTATPDIAYTFWSGGEPNGNAGEPALAINWGAGGNWNDWGPSNSVGYFVEYGGLSVGVPEPAAWAMLIGGFGLLGAASRRRRSASVFD